MKQYIAVVLMLVSAAGPIAMGHHSEAGLDLESVVAFQGVVTEFSWRNPHVYINVETVDGGGQPTEWQFQTHPTMHLTRAGWTRDTFQPGDVVTVRGHPERNRDRKYAILLAIEKEDGTVFGSGFDRESEPTALASDLNGRWKATDESLGPFVAALQAAPLTEKGAVTVAEYDIYTDESILSCQPMPTPVAGIATATLYVSEIELGEVTVILRSEYFDTERHVFMDGRGHPEDGERTVHGHSIGWWEDNVLVVDTRNFANHPSPYQSGVPSGAEKHVVERYDLRDDGSSLMVEVFLEDPEYLAESATATLEWKYTPDAEMFRYNCLTEVSSQFAFQ